MRDDNPNDLSAGEMAAMLKQFAGAFLRILAGVFIVLTIATVNGSRMLGG